MEYIDGMSPSWQDQFVLAKDAATPGDRSQLRRRVQAGELVRVRAGIYVETDVWRSLRADARYLAEVHASALGYRKRLTYSHLSAAALWRLPMVSRWPSAVHTLAPLASGGRSDLQLVRHCVGIPDQTEPIDGLYATSLARTVVDIGRTAKFATAVAMVDCALKKKPREAVGVYAARVSSDLLMAELVSSLASPGSARCRRVLGFADGDSGSPGESVSRVGIRLLDLAAPVLQHSFFDADGFIGTVDFWWPQFNLIGEFDGLGKYLREEYTRGRSAAEVVIDEKIREDRLRALGPGVTRWGWDVASSLPRLRARLMSAGVR